MSYEGSLGQQQTHTKCNNLLRVGDEH